jgi:hypothetical protein
MYGNANKGMDDKFFVQRIPFIFKDSIPSGISQTNHHLLVLDGHGSHVTLKALKQAMTFGLNMITLPSHTSHAFQPLNVSCFKPFKTTLKKNATMARNKYQKPDKITLVGWVDRTLD